MYHLTVADFTPFWYKFQFSGESPLTLRAFAAAVNQHHWARPIRYRFEISNFSAASGR